MIPSKIMQAYNEYRINYYMNIKEEYTIANEKYIDKVEKVLIEKEVNDNE